MALLGGDGDLLAECPGLECERLDGGEECRGSTYSSDMQGGEGQGPLEGTAEEASCEISSSSICTVFLFSMTFS